MKNIFDKWRLFKEVLASDSEESEYEKAISSAETAAGLDPEAQKAAAAEKPKQKTSTSGTIKSSCNCVDSSESGLSVEEIKKLINKYYTEKNPDPSFKKLNVDNDCNLETQKAIMQFQADTGAEQDGCVGDETEGKMVEAGLIDKSTSPQSYSAAGAAAGTAAASATSPSSASSIGAATSSAVTVTVIKSNVKGPSPHYRVVKNNYQGYGRDTSDYDVDKGKKNAKSGNTENDAYFVDGINVGDAIRGKPGLAVLSGRRHKQFGTKILAAVLIAAGAEASNYVIEKGLKRNRGEARLADTSLGRCINKRERAKDPSLPCIMGGWGPGLGRHRWGHQSGLEADLSYYKISGPPESWKPADVGFKNFDYERNCAFTESLLKSEKVEMVLMGARVITAMQKWVRKNGLESVFPNVLSSPKIGKDSKGGHDNHYHLRLHIPSNSPNMRQFKQMLKNKTTGMTKGKSSLMAKLPEEKSKYSFVLGTIDGRVILSHNANQKFHGASIQKPVAALVQMIQYKNDPNKKLTAKELKHLLGYERSGKNLGFQMSNRVNRAISWRRSGQKFYSSESGGKDLGRISRTSMKQVLSNFGITNIDFVQSQNKQSALDYFKFLAGISRMISGKSKNQQEKQFAQEHKQELETIKQFTTYLRSNEKKAFSSMGINNYWGKGGRNGGSLNYGIVIDNKYVIVVYTRFSNAKYGTEEYKTTAAGGTDTNKMLSIFKHLIAKIK